MVSASGQPPGDTAARPVAPGSVPSVATGGLSSGTVISVPVSPGRTRCTPQPNGTPPAERGLASPGEEKRGAAGGATPLRVPWGFGDPACAPAVGQERAAPRDSGPR